MRRAALRSALSAKVADQGIVFVDELDLADAKTNVMAKTLDQLVGGHSALILIPEKGQVYDSFTRSTHNLAHAKTLMANYLNVRDLLGYDKVIISLAALEVITGYLG